MKLSKICYLPIIVVLIWLTFAWTIAFLVDVTRLLDFHLFMPNSNFHFPLIWYYLFSEASPTENLQWLNQFLGLIVSTICWFRLRRTHARLSAYWLGLASGLLIMLVEDSLNFRHLIYGYYLEVLLSEVSILNQYHKTIWELLFYSILSILIIFSGYNLFKAIKPNKQTVFFLFVGYLLYGIAAFGSATRKVFDWQERFGEWIIVRYSLDQLPNWSKGIDLLAKARESSEDYTHTMGYLLIDHWYEESLELLAAGFLITGILLLARCQFEQINTKRY